MKNQKTVKSSNNEKGALLYIVTCALVVIQPLLDIISSVVINLDKANYISFSGAVRALIIAAVTVFTLGFYKGRYSRLFKIYNGIAAAYIILMCLMSATRGDHVTFLYMLGLMADTFFFAFMFLLIFETAQTVGRRVHPSVIAATALIYAITLVISYISKNGTFHYSTSFAVALALLIPSALVFLVSRLGRKKAENAKPIDAALSWIVPAAGSILLLVGAVLSNSKPVLFVSVIFSAGLFIWTFSSWRDGRKENRPPMMRAFISSALFCVLVLAFLPVSPVKSSFDGRLSFKELFYTYNGQQSPTVNPNGEDPIFDDEDDDGNSDYVPNLDSGYVPGSDKKDDDTTKKTTDNSSETPATESTKEPAGDSTDDTSEETSEISTETTKWWQTKPTLPDKSDLESFIKPYIPTLPGEDSTGESETVTENTTDKSDTEEPGTAASEENRSPAAAIGFGALRSPALPNAGAINIDRTVYYAKMFGEGDIQTKLFGLRFAALFDQTDSIKTATKVHSDPIIVALNYGILGFLVYILPAAFIFLKLLAYILLNLTEIFRSAGCAVYMFTSFVIMILSALDGDILAFSAVGGIASVILANALSVSEDARANSSENG
ncbi:MAG: O-antigen ligase family protein [Acutalibacteraceae bacterium]